ncbi:MAG: branched-chain amino acid transport system ATP-binding protein, partial [Sphingomonadales bacterium]|nr:branched-chain amino acid transport system ATP-binding protein [Sphingomonadales bacterium]
GEIVGLVGANAAGKSTLMFSLAGLRTRCTGRISIGDDRIEAFAAFDRVRRGLVLVPERRRLFPFMTVIENLEMGAYSQAARPARRETLAQVYELLPVLAERRGQVAGSLSGGEQQMLAIGRALMAKPQVLLLDEPTEGLAPIYVRLLFQVIRNLRDLKLTIIIVEQNVHHVLRTADRAYVLENGRIVMAGTGEQLLNDERLKVAYLGL